jgi:hypothetical protein
MPLSKEVKQAAYENKPLAKEGDWGTAYHDKASNALYFCNHNMGESSWDPPMPTFPSVALPLTNEGAWAMYAEKGNNEPLTKEDDWAAFAKERAIASPSSKIEEGNQAKYDNEPLAKKEGNWGTAYHDKASTRCITTTPTWGTTSWDLTTLTFPPIALPLTNEVAWTMCAKKGYKELLAGESDWAAFAEEGDCSPLAEESNCKPLAEEGDCKPFIMEGNWASQDDKPLAKEDVDKPLTEEGNWAHAVTSPHQGGQFC